MKIGMKMMDLGPLQRPAEQEDDDLRQDHELNRCHVEREDPLLDDLLPAEQRERRGEYAGADKEPADHGARLGGEKRRLLDDVSHLFRRLPTTPPVPAPRGRLSRQFPM
jgi:hypothetical protein